MLPCSPDYIFTAYAVPGARGGVILSSPSSLYTFRSPGAVTLHLRLGSVLSQSPESFTEFTQFNAG